jgi:hypothetical protein
MRNRTVDRPSVFAYCSPIAWHGNTVSVPSRGRRDAGGSVASKRVAGNRRAHMLCTTEPNVHATVKLEGGVCLRYENSASVRRMHEAEHSVRNCGVQIGAHSVRGARALPVHGTRTDTRRTANRCVRSATANPCAFGAAAAGAKTYDPSRRRWRACGISRERCRTRSRVTSGTLWTTLVAAISSSAGSL